MKGPSPLPSIGRSQTNRLLILLVLLVVPAILLRASLFGGQDYVPFDHTTFAPWNLSLSAEELEARRADSNWDITEKPLLCSPEYRLAKTEIAGAVGDIEIDLTLEHEIARGAVGGRVADRES